MIAIPFKAFVPIADIASKGRSTRLPKPVVQLTRLFVIVIVAVNILATIRPTISKIAMLVCLLI